MYDGPEQVLHFNDMIKKTNVPDNFVILRDRWYKGEEFSDYITNRAGTVKSGHQSKIEELKDKKCFYPAYHAQIDWNGDMYLCPHDWQRRNPVGNLMQKDFFGEMVIPVIFFINLLSLLNVLPTTKQHN